MNEISRRSFVGAAGASAAAIGGSLLAGTAPLASATEGTDGSFELSRDWDDEYDVVIVGFGGAGASAAIEAADAGAKVLLMDKDSENFAGGNSRVSGAWFFSISDKDKAIAAITKGNGGYEDNGGIEMIVNRAADLPDWFESLGASKDDIITYDYDEWEQFPIDGYQCASLTEEEDAVWQLLKSAVQQRSDAITVWYDARCTQIIVDPDTGIAHGCVVEVDGQTLSVRAKNGVILACGGFENSPVDHQNYLAMTRVYPIGSPDNTGDGIALATSAGARLWHMSNYAGCDIGFVNPDTEIAAGQFMDFTYAIVVGDDAKRFRNETNSGIHHGKAYVHGAFTGLPMPENMFCILDDDGRKAAPLYPAWSDENQDEIDDGWIIQADSIEELADDLGLDAEALAETIEEYNGYCASGEDADFGRSADTLFPIETAPFCALKVNHVMWNTFGGAERNAQCQVIGWDGEPIPHLYSAGEFGSFYGRIDSSGYAFTECLTSGQEAGTNAAAAKDDVYAGSVMEGKSPTYVAPATEE